MFTSLLEEREPQEGQPIGTRRPVLTPEVIVARLVTLTSVKYGLKSVLTNISG